jgi:antitoxin component of MazEF toxin-antitoxin module
MDEAMRISVKKMGKDKKVLGAAPKYELEELLAKMDAKTFPEEIDFGKVAGKEVW